MGFVPVRTYTINRVALPCPLKLEGLGLKFLGIEGLWRQMPTPACSRGFKRLCLQALETYQEKASVKQI